MEKLLLTPSEVAETLGIGRTKVYALLASGEMPSVRIGASVRIPVAELKEWLREHSSQTQTRDASDGSATSVR